MRRERGWSERGDVVVVAERDDRGADRRIDVAVGLAGRRERGGQQVRQHLAHLGRPSRRRASAAISESGRKRDAAASTASSSASTSRRAAGSASGSVTTICMSVLHRCHCAVARVRIRLVRRSRAARDRDVRRVVRGHHRRRGQVAPLGRRRCASACAVGASCGDGRSLLDGRCRGVYSGV